jgi:hypothetical protein
MNIHRAAPFILSLFLLQSCKTQQAAPAPKPEPPKIDLSYNDNAQFLAGIPGRPDGPYKELEATPAWKQYSADLTAQWQKADKDQFGLVDAFQKRELAPLKKGSFVFYPFSGPDVLYMNRFFPDGKLFVMCGLEPVGFVRKPSDYSGEKLEKELKNWTMGLNSIFKRSFFVTSEMDQHFRGRVSSGLLPMIDLLLARSGYAIEGVQFGHLDPNGKFIVEEANSGQKHMGVEVAFHRGNENVTRKLYYFSTDVAGKFQEDPSFSKFILAQGTPDTLVKSASFLLHWKMCEAIRAQILATSNIILQDDTGVPYHYLQKKPWKTVLYGEYSHPDRPFTNEYQKDLAADFKDPAKVRPLGFQLGYGAWRRPSSMMLAVREN